MTIRPEQVKPGSNYEEPGNSELSTCIRCGSLVAIRNQGVHDEWHEQLGALFKKVADTIAELIVGDGK